MSSPFKEKEKEGEGRSKAWWPMEGEREGSHAWRPMESSKFGGQWKVKEKSFSPLLTFPNQFYLNLEFFPLTLKF
jgi:hypothetical protein